MFKNPFSFGGRISRKEYCLSYVYGFGLWFICYMFFGIFVGGLFNSGDNMVFPIISLLFSFIPFLWFMLAQGAKRCHDLGNNGWFQIIPFYSLWMLFKDGEYGENNYGVNPKTGKVNDFNADNILDEGI